MKPSPDLHVPKPVHRLWFSMDRCRALPSSLVIIAVSIALIGCAASTDASPNTKTEPISAGLGKRSLVHAATEPSRQTSAQENVNHRLLASFPREAESDTGSIAGSDASSTFDASSDSGNSDASSDSSQPSGSGSGTSTTTSPSRSRTVTVTATKSPVSRTPVPSLSSSVSVSRSPSSSPTSTLSPPAVAAAVSSGGFKLSTQSLIIIAGAGAGALALCGITVIACLVIRRKKQEKLVNSAKTRLPPQGYKPRLSNREESSTVDGGRVLAARIPSVPMSPMLRPDGSAPQPDRNTIPASDPGLQHMGLAAAPTGRQPAPPMQSPLPSQPQQQVQSPPPSVPNATSPVAASSAPGAQQTQNPMPQMFAIRNPNDNTLTFFQHVPQTGSISQVTGPLPGVTRTNVHEYAPVTVPVPQSDSDSGSESDDSEFTVTAAKPSPTRRVIRKKKASSRKASAAARRKLVRDSVLESASEAPSDRESLIAAKVARRLRSSGIGLTAAKDTKPQHSKSMARRRVSEAGNTTDDNASQRTMDTQSTVSVKPPRRKSTANLTPTTSRSSRSSGSNTVSASTVGIQTAMGPTRPHVPIEREVLATAPPPAKQMPPKAESTASTLQMFETEVKSFEAKQEKMSKLMDAFERYHQKRLEMEYGQGEEGMDQPTPSYVNPVVYSQAASQIPVMVEQPGMRYSPTLLQQYPQPAVMVQQPSQIHFTGPPHHYVESVPMSPSPARSYQDFGEDTTLFDEEEDSFAPDATVSTRKPSPPPKRNQHRNTGRRAVETQLDSPLKKSRGTSRRRRSSARRHSLRRSNDSDSMITKGGRPASTSESESESEKSKSTDKPVNKDNVSIPKEVFMELLKRREGSESPSPRNYAAQPPVYEPQPAPIHPSVAGYRPMMPIQVHPQPMYERPISFASSALPDGYAKPLF